jgi:hypothetical protein
VYSAAKEAAGKHIAKRDAIIVLRNNTFIAFPPNFYTLEENDYTQIMFCK